MTAEAASRPPTEVRARHGGRAVLNGQPGWRCSSGSTPSGSRRSLRRLGPRRAGEGAPPPRSGLPAWRRRGRPAALRAVVAARLLATWCAPASPRCPRWRGSPPASARAARRRGSTSRARAPRRRCAIWSRTPALRFPIVLDERQVSERYRVRGVAAPGAHRRDGPSAESWTGRCRRITATGGGGGPAVMPSDGQRAAPRAGGV